MKKLLTAVLFAAAVATPLATSAASMPKVEKIAAQPAKAIFRMTKSLTASNPSARIKTHR